MRRARFRDPSGSTRVGEWRGDTVAFGGREYAVEDVEILPPTTPSKVVGVGLNYADHAEEYDLAVPDRPLLFAIPPNSVAGHRDTVELLPDKDTIEHEAELGVVIGEQCRDVDRDDATDVIAGYTCVNDVSNRDDQLAGDSLDLFRGKAFDGATPVGPAVAEPDHLPDDAIVQLRVNGETRQRSSIDDLLFGVEELVEEVTTFVTLEPGDVITTGTPAGVGSLSPGDRVEVEIEGVGVLENDVGAR